MSKTHTANTYELLQQNCQNSRFQSNVDCRQLSWSSQKKKISECNQKPVRNVRTYDFSTLYTSNPHKKLKERMAIVINQCFNGSGRRYIHIGRTTATWNRAKGKDNHSWNANDLISHVNYLIDNIYVVCGNVLFRQVIGIPMGTDCAPFLANLFLYSYECEWMCQKLKNKEFDILNKST